MDEEDGLVSEPPSTKWDFFKPFAGAKPSEEVKSDEEFKDEDQEEGEGGEDEDSWIVEDDGLEDVPELPVAFNMSSHQDLSHHFKIICQLFVHLAVRSPSQRVSFIRDVKAGEHLNVSTADTLFHVVYGIYCPTGLCLLQPKTITSTPHCQRSDER